MSPFSLVRRLWTTVLDVPRALYPDSSVYWRARTFSGFCLIGLSLGPLVVVAGMLSSPEFRVRALQIETALMSLLAGGLWITRRMRGGAKIAGRVLVASISILAFLWSLSGYGLFDTAMFGFLWMPPLATMLLGLEGTVLSLLLGGAALSVLTWLSLSGWEGWLWHAPVPMPAGAVQAFAASAISTMVTTAIMVAMIDGARSRLSHGGGPADPVRPELRTSALEVLRALEQLHAVAEAPPELRAAIDSTLSKQRRLHALLSGEVETSP